MLLFSSLFSKNVLFCYLLRSISLSLLNIREIFRCRLWRQSFFECMDERFAMANVSFASTPFSFFGIPIALLLLSLKLSRTRTRTITHTHWRMNAWILRQGNLLNVSKFFTWKLFNWCITQQIDLHQSKIHWKFTLLHTLIYTDTVNE